MDLNNNGGAAHGASASNGGQHLRPIRRGSTSGSSTKRPRLVSKAVIGRTNKEERFRHGTFSAGTSIFRNRLHRGEKFEMNGHVTLANLVLPNCTSALCTTFCHESDNNTTWLQDEILKGVSNVLLVLHDPDREVGDAKLQRSINQKSGWIAVRVKPHTGGCLHAKLLLFRSASGLRVAVCGSNLYQAQWEQDRDALWLQDFYPYGESLVDHDDDVASVNSAGDVATATDSFALDLRFFLDDLTQCRERNDTFQVQSQLDDLFRGIDFQTAAAKFVFSFPRPLSSTKERGGWRQLAEAVHDLLEDTTKVKNRQREQGSEKPLVVYAMSGSVGNLEPDFLLQMQQAMQGSLNPPRNPTHWEDVQHIRFLWPSRETALGMNLCSLMDSGRAIPSTHWESIPESAKRRIFLDAIPNPTELALPHLGCHPFSHAKVIFATTGDNVVNGYDDQNTSIVYVGSHNFSKAAWGLRNAMPRNVEAGVVLTPANLRECRDRLPCLLPCTTEMLSPVTYIPASVPADIQQVFYSGQYDKALSLLRDRWVVKSDGVALLDNDKDSSSRYSLESP